MINEVKQACLQAEATKATKGLWQHPHLQVHSWEGTKSPCTWCYMQFLLHCWQETRAGLQVRGSFAFSCLHHFPVFLSGFCLHLISSLSETPNNPASHSWALKPSCSCTWCVETQLSFSLYIKHGKSNLSWTEKALEVLIVDSGQSVISYGSWNVHWLSLIIALS